MVYTWIAASAFGLEGAIAGELRRLGLSDVQADNGSVRFQGSLLDGYRCNLSLRFSDRVYLLPAGRIFSFPSGVITFTSSRMSFISPP